MTSPSIYDAPIPYDSPKTYDSSAFDSTPPPPPPPPIPTVLIPIPRVPTPDFTWVKDDKVPVADDQ